MNEDVTEPRFRVGWIGLGAMGGTMARNVQQAGLPLIVYDRRPEAMAPLVTGGATAAASAAEVAENCDAVFACLAGEETSLSVAAEVLNASVRPEVYVEHSTLTPATMVRIAGMATAAGVQFLDAPVSGSKQARDAGHLAIMIGGDEAALDKVRVVIAAYGDKIIHLGPVGSGSIAKLTHNQIALTSCLAIVEGLLLGASHGIPMDKLRDAFMAGAATSPFAAHIANSYMSRAYRDGAVPEATMRLVIKDLKLARELAAVSGQRIDMASRALEIWEEAVEAGLGDREMFWIIDYLELARPDRSAASSR